MHCIWKQRQDGSDDRRIGECIEAIRSNTDASDPIQSPDPIAFIGIFAIVLIRLVPEEVAWRRSDEIYDLMLDG